MVDETTRSRNPLLFNVSYGTSYLYWGILPHWNFSTKYLLEKKKEKKGNSRNKINKLLAVNDKLKRSNRIEIVMVY